MKITIFKKKFTLSFSFFVTLPLFYLFNSYRKSRKVIVQKKSFNAYVADNFFSRAFGYMFREKNDLKKDESMLFVFDSPTTVTFTMSNVDFPIRVFALDKNYKVLDEALMKKGQSKKTKLSGTLFLEIPITTK